MLNRDEKVKIAVLISGMGTNLQALIDAVENGIIKNGKISLVISSNKDAYGLKRASKHGIENIFIPSEKNDRVDNFEKSLTKELRERKIDLIVLAGFMKILSEDFVKKYPNRIINIHPSLIPSFCGKGAYGIHVHEMALDYGVKVTGATVHFVNEIPDGGKIILQKAVEIKEKDTPEILQKRVMREAEWTLLPKAVSMVCDKIMEEKNESL